MNTVRNLVLLLLLMLTSCSGLTPTDAVSTATTPATATVTLVPTPTLTSTPVGPRVLRIWLPPQFDPESGDPAGQILKARLVEFSNRRPDVRIETRVKALNGSGGLLDSLTTASSAAPLSMPDLVALPRPLLETAALKGLLRSYDEVDNSIDQSGWYEYARELARLQDSTYGLPFAGDALVLVYRTTTVPSVTSSLSEMLQVSGPLAFSAADPQALFTLAQYQAAGGLVLDDDGRPTLQNPPLAGVLRFYLEAASSELAPFWITQFQTDEQSWEAFVEGQAEMVVTWTSRYLVELQADFAAVPLPTLDGSAYTLAAGWVWALATVNPEYRALSLELAQFLSDSRFLANWTGAIGYLPPSSSAMASWRTAALRSFASQVSQSARLYPSADVLTIIAPVLQKATVDVLKQQIDPQAAAQAAVESILNP